MPPVLEGKVAIFGAGGPVGVVAARALQDRYTLRVTDVRPLSQITTPQSPGAPLPQPLPQLPKQPLPKKPLKKRLRRPKPLRNRRLKLLLRRLRPLQPKLLLPPRRPIVPRR